VAKIVGIGSSLRGFSSSIVGRGGLRPVPSLKWTVATGKQIKRYTGREESQLRRRDFGDGGVGVVIATTPPPAG
jgi:hypothetical protein